MKQYDNSPNPFKHTELSESEIQKILLNFKMKMYDLIFTTLNFFFFNVAASFGFECQISGN